MLQSKDYIDVITKSENYNSSGKPESVKTYQESIPMEYMYEKYTYTEDDLLKTESDPRYKDSDGKLKTQYDYNVPKMLMTKRTEVNGQEYNYTYDNSTEDLKTLSTAVGSQTLRNDFYYTQGQLTRIAHNGFDYKFGFDALGRRKSVKVNDDTLVTTSYTLGENSTVTSSYANGEVVKETFDRFGNPTKKEHTVNGYTSVTYTKEYDESGKLVKMIDSLAKVRVLFCHLPQTGIGNGEQYSNY